MMIETHNSIVGNVEQLDKRQLALQVTLRNACKKIAPVWPLENFVAVNPFLGHTHNKFEHVAHELAAAGGIQMTLPTAFYLQKIKDGTIKNEDLANVLNKRSANSDVKEFIKALECSQNNDEVKAVPSAADVVTEITGKDWGRFMVARISAWASSYFDNGQAIWAAADQNQGLFASWKAEAEIDRTPELTGLKNFRNIIKELPNNPLEATEVALSKLRVPSEGTPLYLHRILLRMGGWAAYAARLDWDNELYGGKDGKLIEFLAVLTCWEACLLENLANEEINKKWKEAKAILSRSNVQKELNQELAQQLILQEAFDLAAQRKIVDKFKQQKPLQTSTNEQPKAQAVFCIDVRSEVFRRNLELVDDRIETLGFAGFFAFPIKFVPIGHTNGEANCPVLLKTGPTIMEQLPDDQEHQLVINKRILDRQIQQVWKSFKSGAVTCFSFVSPMGLSYLPKLFTDSFGITRPVPHPDKVGLSKEATIKKSVSLDSQIFKNDTTGIPIEQQIAMAKNALNAMSLTDNFGKFILIVGHGSTMVNNPHATGYDCGACGGHTGEANARVASAVLNNSEVRAALSKENILIPQNTIFLACLHDTTTDEVTIYNEWDVPASQIKELNELKKSLAQAGQATRGERAIRLTQENGDTDKAIMTRSKDWSQIRPEWGLAGCSTFVVAPRSRTKGINLEGKSFLHSYEWQKDNEFVVLELIMTAPMVVTSWINLQYYGSTVDNKNLGSGNKTLHNVTAGIGVLEGYSGDLRVGLPLQSIHDGKSFQHDPLRLNVIIEAPIAAMNAILEKHESVRNLCDNGWLKLLAMDDSGKVSHRYNGNLSWEAID